MRKGLILAMVVAVGLALTSGAIAGKPNNNCTKIQDGALTYSAGRYLEGEPLMPGYDPYGYNYQAHLFNGSYANYYLNVLGLPPYEGDTDAYYQRLVDEGFAADIEEAESLMSGISWLWDYRDIRLLMKWNDAWLSNKDCDGDGLLDRHYGYDSYIGSGAWETNHQSGVDGVDPWIYFVKIVAVPEDATLDGGVWYAADGTVIGPSIWGAFAIIQEVESGEGATFVSPAGPGFGHF